MARAAKSTRRRLAVAAVAAIALAACSRRPERMRLESVRLAEGALSSPLGEAGLEEAALIGAARAALRSAGFEVDARKGSQLALVAVTSVRLISASGGGGARAQVSVEIALGAKGSAQPSSREEATGSAPLATGAPPREAWLGAVTQASQRAAQALAIAILAEAKGVEDLVADLGARDVRVREEAIRVLGERRSKAAVPALIARLKEEEPRLLQRVIAALAQIGDERAVPPLIEMSSSAADPELTTRVIRYIGDIGGSEAEGYLLTLESGHPDRRVRRAAREALDDMSARAKEAALAARK